jgi:ubiquinone/menaquinone biosynthesis C-methylase UbiE
MKIGDSVSRHDHDRVFNLIMAGFAAQAVRTLASLSVAEHLSSGPLSAARIAELTSSDPHMTYRVLRAGAALGLLKYEPDEAVFSGTSALQVLHKDSPMCLKHYALAALSQTYWLPALYMPDSITRGHNYAIELLGCSPFEYLGRDKEAARIFSRAMTDLSTPVIREAVELIEVGDARFVVDVGGADGAFLAELMQLHPHLTGTVLDLPQVMPGVAEEARRRGLEQRMTGTEGNFFKHVPSADLYLVKFVLHDWDDQACRKILRNIRRAMNPGARVVIVEMIVTHDSITATLMDLAMMTSFTGREREEDDFTHLLEATELKIDRTIGLHSPYRLIEAVAV